MKRVPVNTADSQYAEALAKAWSEYNNPRAVIIVVVQAEERNMYDQHFVSAILRERYPFLNS
ncbi:glutathione synthetase chloroplastic-like [Trifolium medium]|uniref:Glutathione synthetase chloroplastic-like n=1 Tax=Trifolium medium TaxID=97028 RepID=A0A392PZN3_9FABA|nr:glutathione synthetase chloroplastic-like [Trifolium medium]